MKRKLITILLLLFSLLSLFACGDENGEGAGNNDAAGPSKENGTNQGYEGPIVDATPDSIN